MVQNGPKISPNTITIDCDNEYDYVYDDDDYDYILPPLPLLLLPLAPHGWQPSAWMRRASLRPATAQEVKMHHPCEYGGVGQEGSSKPLEFKYRFVVAWEGAWSNST